MSVPIVEVIRLPQGDPGSMKENDVVAIKKYFGVDK